ncbi:MAG: hypothetical protein PHV66_04335, partial [Bacteroidales bacterium]|nr:hypothetical protein [Bacteroidales bacterium]
SSSSSMLFAGSIPVEPTIISLKTSLTSLTNGNFNSESATPEREDSTTAKFNHRLVNRTVDPGSTSFTALRNIGETGKSVESIAIPLSARRSNAVCDK